MSTTRLLLVEDNPDDAELTMGSLQAAVPYATIGWVEDGAEALDYLFGRGNYAANPPPPPGVVLLDLSMPKIGGLEVLKAIRADSRIRRVPVVVLTSSNEESDITRSYDLGANSYVVKPVDFDDFNETVRTLGLFWGLCNRRPGE